MKLHLNDIPEGVVINGYGDDYIDINGEHRKQSVLITPGGVADAVLPASTEELTGEHLRPIAQEVQAEVFILGAGSVTPPIRSEWLSSFAEVGVSLEIMSLPAACRTYNILQGDGRAAAVILILPG